MIAAPDSAQHQRPTVVRETPIVAAYAETVEHDVIAYMSHPDT